MPSDRRVALTLADRLRSACIDHERDASTALELVDELRRNGATADELALGIVLFVTNEAHNAPRDEDRAVEVTTALLARLIHPPA